MASDTARHAAVVESSPCTSTPIPNSRTIRFALTRSLHVAGPSTPLSTSGYHAAPERRAGLDGAWLPELLREEARELVGLAEHRIVPGVQLVPDGLQALGRAPLVRLRGV